MSGNSMTSGPWISNLTCAVEILSASANSNETINTNAYPYFVIST